MFEVTIKKGYHEIKFTFKEWNEASDFAGDAVLHGEKGLAVQLSLTEEKEENDE